MHSWKKYLYKCRKYPLPEQQVVLTSLYPRSGVSCNRFGHLLYPRSGVSCNRFGHLGWNQFFNLLKYSLLELQSDRRSFSSNFIQLKSSRSFPGLHKSALKSRSHPILILPSQQNIEMCLQLSKYWTMFFGVWGLHNPPAILQLLQPPEEPPEAS